MSNKGQDAFSPAYSQDNPFNLGTLGQPTSGPFAQALAQQGLGDKAASTLEPASRAGPSLSHRNPLVNGGILQQAVGNPPRRSSSFQPGDVFREDVSPFSTIPTKSTDVSREQSDQSLSDIFFTNRQGKPSKDVLPSGGFKKEFENSLRGGSYANSIVDDDDYDDYYYDDSVDSYADSDYQSSDLVESGASQYGGSNSKAKDSRHSFDSVRDYDEGLEDPYYDYYDYAPSPQAGDYSDIDYTGLNTDTKNNDNNYRYTQYDKESNNGFSLSHENKERPQESSTAVDGESASRYAPYDATSTRDNSEKKNFPVEFENSDYTPVYEQDKNKPRASEYGNIDSLQYGPSSSFPSYDQGDETKNKQFEYSNSSPASDPVGYITNDYGEGRGNYDSGPPPKNAYVTRPNEGADRPFDSKMFKEPVIATTKDDGSIIDRQKLFSTQQEPKGKAGENYDFGTPLDNTPATLPRSQSSYSSFSEPGKDKRPQFDLPKYTPRNEVLAPKRADFSSEPASTHQPNSDSYFENDGSPHLVSGKLKASTQPLTFNTDQILDGESLVSTETDVVSEALTKAGSSRPFVSSGPRPIYRKRS